MAALFLARKVLQYLEGGDEAVQMDNIGGVMNKVHERLHHNLLGILLSSDYKPTQLQMLQSMKKRRAKSYSKHQGNKFLYTIPPLTRLKAYANQVSLAQDDFQLLLSSKHV